MDISSIAAVATNMAEQRVQSAIGLTVLKKAIDLQAAGALSLLQAIPAPSPAMSSETVGGVVDTWA
ncbi:MAG: YjfB family protein [Azoarcus sp.]|nr:YjfB family protein [Azoarcus sp.]